MNTKYKLTDEFYRLDKKGKHFVLSPNFGIKENQLFLTKILPRMEIVYNRGTKQFKYWIDDNNHVERDEFKKELAKRKTKVWQALYGEL